MASSDLKWAVWLVCPEGHHDPVCLPHKEPIAVGRTPELRIVDPRCSRKQVELTADLHTGLVEVKQLGSNSSAVDGIEMIKDKVYTMKPHSILYILTGSFPQKLKMEALNDTSGKKEKYKSSSETEKKSTKDKNGKDRSRHSSSSEKHKSSHSTHHNSLGKKRSSSSDNTEVPFKKPRLPENGEINKHSSSKSYSSSSSKTRMEDDDDDDRHTLDIAAKLAVLKSSAKTIKTPLKDSGSKLKTPERIKTSDTPSTSKGSSSKSPSTESKWDQHDTLYVYTSKGMQSKSKIAGFDIDGTIITTKSGKVFSTGPGDWRLLYYVEIPKKIRKLYESDYKIVFFTNQMGVSKGKTSIEELKSKFEGVVKEVGVPVQILVSTKGGLFRKPCTGMWNFLQDKLNDDVKINVSESFYVGDAAGRPKDWKPKTKKDFSNSDRLFALNIGLEFKTPEEYFLGYPTTTKFTMPEFDPREVNPRTHMFDPKDSSVTLGKQEVILLAGYPASGKSFFAKRYLEPKGYVHVNRDKLGTWQKCVKLCSDALGKGQSVVVDNTNPDVESRARYLKLATAASVPCRCFVFTASPQQARHNERFREITDKSHQAINDMIMNTFKGKYVIPDRKEGFTEVVKVNFVPKFKDPNLEALYRMFLLEK